jgi:TPP-dependent pyruvate/acetoin dehydrogenase alpha subunit
MSDTGYRSREEVAAWRARCPIQRLRTSLLDGATATESELAAIDTEIQASVADAVAFAKSSAWPDVATATTHVFSDC